MTWLTVLTGAASLAGLAVATGAVRRERRARGRDAAVPVTGREVLVGGRRVRIEESGPTDTGHPAVVLLTGAGDPAASWSLVRQRLSPTCRVFGYDRAGMGTSDDRPGPRTVNGSVEDLTGALVEFGRECVLSSSAASATGSPRRSSNAGNSPCHTARSSDGASCGARQPREGFSQ